MGMPLTRKNINAELAKRGHTVLLENGGGYFYFYGGEVAGWLDRTVQVPKVSSLTLDQWIEEFGKLKKLNAQVLGSAKGRGMRTKKRSAEI
jgi:hypothetical protein